MIVESTRNNNNAKSNHKKFFIFHFAIIYFYLKVEMINQHHSSIDGIYRKLEFTQIEMIFTPVMCRQIIFETNRITHLSFYFNLRLFCFAYFFERLLVIHTEL